MLTDLLTLENAELALSLLGALSVVLFPTLAVKIKLARQVLREISRFVEKDPRPNQEVFEQARKQGLDKLAQHINQTVDPHEDFYNPAK